MQKADVKLIIEGGPVTPGILRVFTETDEHKLSEIYARLDRLGAVMWMMIDSMGSRRSDPQKQVEEAMNALYHVRDSVEDVAAIAGGFARQEDAA